MGMGGGEAKGSADKEVTGRRWALELVWAAVSNVMDRGDRQGVGEGIGRVYIGGVIEDQCSALWTLGPFYIMDTSTYTMEGRDESMNGM